MFVDASRCFEGVSKEMNVIMSARDQRKGSLYSLTFSGTVFTVGEGN